ncbi:MAG TPA: sialate O-acetylesterase [Capsulimonadaceae bacterium]|nr:sialate O-acetylesterase [Capsulimonadaceae bacterium]
MGDLWILAGQSNMEGVGILQDVEPPSNQVRVYAHCDEWQEACEPLHWMIESPDPVHAQLWGISESRLKQAREDARRFRPTGAGLGLSFAKAVAAAAETTIDLVPCAHGGTSMEQWSPDKKHLGGGSLYGAMLRRTHRALETGGEVRLRGILWYQGESEANPDGASVYFERMKSLIAAVRQDLDAPNLPFYLVQLGAFATTDAIEWAGSIAWSQIREAQRRLPEVVEHTAVVPAIDLELDDFIHIGTQGLKRLGRRLANVALANVYGQSAPRGISLGGVKKDGGAIRVRFEGVSGGLKAYDPAGRTPGFAIGVNGERPETSLIFKAQVGKENPGEVVLQTQEETPAGAELWYGWGLSPFCQLTDQADMAAPAFGPISLG